MYTVHRAPRRSPQILPSGPPVMVHLEITQIMVRFHKYAALNSLLQVLPVGMSLGSIPMGRITGHRHLYTYFEKGLPDRFLSDWNLLLSPPHLHVDVNARILTHTLYTAFQ